MSRLMIHHLFIIGLSVLAVFGWTTERTFAQVLYGTIVGNVQDTTGAAIPGAAVVAIHQETNLTRETVTNEVGAFSIGNAPVGLYTIRVSHPGFRQFVRTNVRVTLGAVTRSDVTLQIGEIEDTIADTPGRALTTNISGTNRNNNATRLDGAVNVHIWLPHHTAYVAPAETIDTVNITTNNFDAEQGMAGGAAITVVTRSGTNEFKGSISTLWRCSSEVWAMYQSALSRSARGFSRPDLDSPIGWEKIRSCVPATESPTIRFPSLDPCVDSTR